MVAILPVNDMPKWRFTIVHDIFLYEKNLKVILNKSGQYQLVHFENSVEFIERIEGVIQNGVQSRGAGNDCLNLNFRQNFPYVYTWFYKYR